MTIDDGKTTNDFYPSKWLKAEDIDKDKPVFQIADVNAEILGDDREAKLVLAFRETTKQLALNKTNAGVLSKLYSDNPNGWITKHIELFTEYVSFRGEMIEAVRIKPVVPEAPAEEAIPM